MTEHKDGQPLTVDDIVWLIRHGIDPGFRPCADPAHDEAKGGTRTSTCPHSGSW